MRVSPQKRLVLDLIREVRTLLMQSQSEIHSKQKRKLALLRKLLTLLSLTQKNNFGLEKANLVVSETFARGPTMKRFRPRAKGSAS